MKTQI